MDPILITGFEKSGFVTFGLAEGGIAYLMSNTPIRTTDDLHTHKVWISGNDPITAEVPSRIGINLFIASYQFEKNVNDIYWAAFPFMIVLLLSLLVITYVPSLTLLFRLWVIKNDRDDLNGVSESITVIKIFPLKIRINRSKEAFMLTLKEQLAALKEKTAAMITPEVSAAMQKGFKELQSANLLEKTLKVGDTAPDFVLPNGEGNMISSETLRNRGPLVILFYRGKW